MKVSILIAARNEEQSLSRCLDSILATSFPKDQFQVLIGNDASEDGTLAIAQQYAQEYPFIEVYDINKEIHSLRGKANVLAQLAHQAEGEFFLFTDADMVLPKLWIETMIYSAEKEKLDIVNGVTLVEGNSFWSRWQSLDWMYALGLMKILSELNIHVAAMGNNMLISKEAYWKTGGYENIPFSVTEDFSLYREVIKQGGNTKQLYRPEVLGFTEPVKGLNGWLQQRKRWMKGAMMLPWYIIFAILMNILLIPTLVIGAFYETILLELLLVTIVLRISSLCWFISDLKIPSYRGWNFLFEPLYSLLYMLLMIYYLMPVNVKWKGRIYL